MTATVTLRGVVATEPRHLITEAGVPITAFRMLAPPRCGAVASGDDRGWFTVSALHALAVNVAQSVSEGDPVLVTGRLRFREWLGEPHGVTAEVEAETIGPDLVWGRCEFVRTVTGRSVADLSRLPTFPQGGSVECEI